MMQSQLLKPALVPAAGFGFSLSLSRSGSGLPGTWCIGWITHDKSNFGYTLLVTKDPLDVRSERWSF